MTTEEMERTIEFLLQSQAKHDAQIGELRELVAETARAVQMQATSQSQLNGTLTNAITALADAQSKTDERLTRLAGVVERFVEGRGRE
jgi:ABC-type transporter Mla subunit MlaD